MVDRIAKGDGRAEDIDLLNSVADNIQGRTICALGDAAAMPVRAMIKHFRDEFSYLIEHKTSKVAALAAQRSAGPPQASLPLSGGRTARSDGLGTQ